MTAHNMAGMEQMKLSDEIDRAAYAHLADPAPDQECIKMWRKLDIPLVGGIAVVTVNTVQSMTPVQHTTVCM